MQPMQPPNTTPLNPKQQIQIPLRFRVGVLFSAHLSISKISSKLIQPGSLLLESLHPIFERKLLFVYPTSPVYRENLQPSSAEKLQVLPQVESELVSWLTLTEDYHTTNQTFLLSPYRTFEIPHHIRHFVCVLAKVKQLSGFPVRPGTLLQTCCFLERPRQLTAAAQLSSSSGSSQTRGKSSRPSTGLYSITSQSKRGYRK